MKTKSTKNSTKKNKLKFGSAFETSSGVSTLTDEDEPINLNSKTLVGRNSLAGRPDDTAREHVLTYLTRIRGVVTTEGHRAASEKFNHITAADDLKAFTFLSAWDYKPDGMTYADFNKLTKGSIPSGILPTDKRLELIYSMSEIINFDVALGEKIFEQKKLPIRNVRRSGKKKTKFGAQFSSLDPVSEESAAPQRTEPTCPPEWTLDELMQMEIEGSSQVSMSDASSIASTATSLDSLAKRTSQVISTYMSLWYFSTKDPQNFLQSSEASEEIKKRTETFFNTIARYYDTALTEEGLPTNPTLIERLREAAAGMMVTPDGMASFGMGYAHLASMKLQELYAMIAFTRPSASTLDFSKQCTYKQIIEDAKTLETRPHSPYMYNRLKKWLSINKDYDTPKSQIEWYRIQTIYFVRKRLLKYKKVLKIINFFAENILSSRIFINYIASQEGGQYNKALILKTCIAEITVAISGIFYMNHEQKLPTDGPLSDSTPTTLRNVALVIFTQLGIIDSHIKLEQKESLEIRQKRTQPLLSTIPLEVLQQNAARDQREGETTQPTAAAYINLRDSPELEAWTYVYKIGSLILEQIIELSRVQGMQPGIYYDFDDEVLPVELTPDNFWGQEFATAREVKNNYISSWKSLILVPAHRIPPITIPPKVGLEEPFYFIKNYPKIALHFINIEMRNVQTEQFLDEGLINFIKYFAIKTGATEPNVSFLEYVQGFSHNIFTAVLTAKALAITPGSIYKSVEFAVSTLTDAKGVQLHPNAIKFIFNMSLSFLEATYTNIPWRIIWQGATTNNVLMITAVIYCLSTMWSGRTPSVENNASDDGQLIKLLESRIQELPIFTRSEFIDRLPIVLEHWAKQTSDPVRKIPVGGFDIIRLQSIYLNLLQKPGLVVIYHQINSKLNRTRPEGGATRTAEEPEPIHLYFRQLNITKIEEFLSIPENDKLLELYNTANSVDGFSQSKGLDTYLSNFDISNIVSVIWEKLAILTTPESSGAPSTPGAGGARPPSPGAGGAGGAGFGKLAKVFEPYREFVFDVKKTGDKRGIYVKTRFGVKKVKDDKYGLYVKADGKKFHLYKW